MNEEIITTTKIKQNRLTMNTKGMPVVGKGLFSTVYKQGKRQVLIKTTDKAKNCMAMGFFPNTSMFPKTKNVGQGNDGSYFYTQRFYEKKRSLKNNLATFEYEFYKVLREIFKNLYYESSISMCYSLIHTFEKQIPNKFRHKRKMLIEAVEALMNYGEDICFEISPRNVTSHNGRLILMDCFFFNNDARKEKQKRYGSQW